MEDTSFHIEVKNSSQQPNTNSQTLQEVEEQGNSTRTEHAISQVADTHTEKHTEASYTHHKLPHSTADCPAVNHTAGSCTCNKPLAVRTEAPPPTGTTTTKEFSHWYSGVTATA